MLSLLCPTSKSVSVVSCDRNRLSGQFGAWMMWITTSVATPIESRVKLYICQSPRWGCDSLLSLFFSKVVFTWLRVGASAWCCLVNHFIFVDFLPSSSICQQVEISFSKELLKNSTGIKKSPRNEKFCPQWFDKTGTAFVFIYDWDLTRNTAARKVSSLSWMIIKKWCFLHDCLICNQTATRFKFDGFCDICRGHELKVPQFLSFQGIHSFSGPGMKCVDNALR